MALLETIIRTCLLPNLTDQSSFSEAEHKLFAHPAHLGSLGVIDPSQYSVSRFSSLVYITAALVQSILQHSSVSSVDVLLA